MRRALMAFVALGAVAAPAGATTPGENGPIAFQRELMGGGTEVHQFAIGAAEPETRLVELPNARQPTWCHDRVVIGTRVSTSLGLLERLQSDPAGFATSDGGTAAKFRADQPSCARDGDLVAFTGGPLTTDDIFRVAAGGAPQRLTTDPGDDESPDWSPDGRRIAFDSDRDGDREILVMDAGGAGQTPLTVNAVEDSEPSWSPDGSRIAFFSARGPVGIWSMRTDGGDARFLGVGREPAWSPDGTRVAYRDSLVAGTGGIAVMDADGTQKQRLSSGDVVPGVLADAAPAWRPVRPAPVVTGLSPSTTGTVVAGSAGLRLRILGSRFIIGTTATWNGADRPTTLVSGTELLVDVPASDLGTPGTAAVGVRTPPPGGGTSGGLVVTITVPAAPRGGPADAAVAIAGLRGTGRGVYRMSRLRGGAVTVSGRTPRAARLLIRVRSGGRVAARAAVAAPGGPFTRRLALPAGTPPGRLVVTVTEVGAAAGAPPLAGSVDVTLAAPPEGVAAPAWISTAAGGPVRARIPRQPRFLVANFRLTALPRAGRRLAIVWRLGRASFTIPALRPQGRLLTGQLGTIGGGRIARGRWTATLAAGGTPVAVARVRVG